MSFFRKKVENLSGLPAYLIRFCYRILWKAHAALDKLLLAFGVDVFSSRKVPKIFLLLIFRNEEKYLPGFFENVLPHVDGVVALDDGSTDRSAEIVRKQPKILELHVLPDREPHEWNEPLLKNKILEIAKKYHPEWLLSLDADERLEKHFRERANREIMRAMSFGFKVLNLRLYELWGSESTARVDGIWGKKVRQRLFLWDTARAFSSAELHGQWISNRPNEECEKINADLIFYHLKMIHSEDRERRKQLYKRLDPHNQFQKIGYDYLTDDQGLKLKNVVGPRGYLSESMEK